jgi:hypothetical protein
MPFSPKLSRAIVEGGYLLFLMNRDPDDFWSFPINEWEAASWGIPRDTRQASIVAQKPTISLTVTYRVLQALKLLCGHDIGDEAKQICEVMIGHRNPAGAYGNQGQDRIINASSRHTASALMTYFTLLDVGVAVLTQEQLAQTIDWLLRNQEDNNEDHLGGWALESGAIPDWQCTGCVVEALVTALRQPRLIEDKQLSKIRTAVSGGVKYWVKDFTAKIREWNGCQGAIYVKNERMILDSCDSLKRMAILTANEVSEDDVYAINLRIKGLMGCQIDDGSVGNSVEHRRENTIMFASMLLSGNLRAEYEAEFSKSIDYLNRALNDSFYVLKLHAHEIAHLLQVVAFDSKVKLSPSDTDKVRKLQKTAGQPIDFMNALPELMRTLYGRNFEFIFTEGRNYNKAFLELLRKLPNLSERMFFAETMKCYQSGAYRACVVTAWCLAFDHLLNWIFSDPDRINAFNATIVKQYPKRTDVVILDKEDFEKFKEFEIIEICRASSIMSKNVVEILREKLKKRNAAAHPSQVVVTQSQADDVITDLINNVVLALS